MLKDRLENERKRLGLTQEQLALKINTSRQNITNWEIGYSVPSLELLNNCSQVFGCTTDYLLGNSKYRNIFEKFDNEIDIQNIKNNIKILNYIPKDLREELHMEDIISKKDEDYIHISSIIMNKLQEMNLTNNNREISENELNVILNFIENNKDMLKTMIENEKRKE